ncbi:MAG: orotidine-5'-phosphate decarboxylase [Hyphomicrobiaceae bacterium]
MDKSAGRDMGNVANTDKLIVALDFPAAAEARALVTRLGDAVSFYKVGHELLFAGGLELARALKGEGKRVFLDMKLLDIGNTMERSVANAASMGVDFLTIHGHDTKTIRAAVTGRADSPLKILAVTVLTNLSAEDVAEQGNAMTPAQLVLHRALLTYAAGCDGVIASGQEAAAIRAKTGPGFLIVTPGIRPAGEASGDQTRVMTPEAALAAGANHIVVGRPVTQAADPRAAALGILSALS